MVAELTKKVQQAPAASSGSLRLGEQERCDLSSDGAAGEGGDASSVEVSYHHWRIKWAALSLALFLTAGSNYASSIIPPLKSTLQKELVIDNAQYAVLDTADALLNTILPILSGVAIDYFGPLVIGACAASSILAGAVLTAVAIRVKHYPLMVGAQIIKGVGDTTIKTVQYKIYSWYSVGMMAFIYALDISVERVCNLAGKLSAVPILNRTGHLSWVFWTSAILCGASWTLMLAFFMYERTLSTASRVPTGRRCAKRAAARAGVASPSLRNSISIKLSPFAATVFAIPACFWMIEISQLFQTGAMMAYTTNLADTIRITRNLSTEAAGFTAAIGQVMPIVLTPCLGVCFDRWGHRMHWVAATAVIYIVVFILLAYTDVNALVPSILGSLALATNVLPWIASVPILAPDQRHLGTAFGIFKCLANCGTVVVSVVSGVIQDQSGTGVSQYNSVFAFLIAIKGLDVIWGLVYNWLDTNYLDGVLIKGDHSRRKEVATMDEERLRGIKTPIRSVTVVAIVIVVAAVVVAWLLYFYFAV